MLTSSRTFPDRKEGIELEIQRQHSMSIASRSTLRHSESLILTNNTVRTVESTPFNEHNLVPSQSGMPSTRYSLITTGDNRSIRNSTRSPTPPPRPPQARRPKAVQPPVRSPPRHRQRSASPTMRRSNGNTFVTDGHEIERSQQRVRTHSFSEVITSERPNSTGLSPMRMPRAEASKSAVRGIVCPPTRNSSPLRRHSHAEKKDSISASTSWNDDDDDDRKMPAVDHPKPRSPSERKQSIRSDSEQDIRYRDKSETDKIRVIEAGHYYPPTRKTSVSRSPTSNHKTAQVRIEDGYDSVAKENTIRSRSPTTSHRRISQNRVEDGYERVPRERTNSSRSPIRNHRSTLQVEDGYEKVPRERITNPSRVPTSSHKRALQARREDSFEKVTNETTTTPTPSRIPTSNHRRVSRDRIDDGSERATTDMTTRPSRTPTSNHRRTLQVRTDDGYEKVDKERTTSPSRSPTSNQMRTLQVRNEDCYEKVSKERTSPRQPHIPTLIQMNVIPLPMTSMQHFEAGPRDGTQENSVMPSNHSNDSAEVRAERRRTRLLMNEKKVEADARRKHLTGEEPVVFKASTSSFNESFNGTRGSSNSMNGSNSQKSQRVRTSVTENEGSKQFYPIKQGQRIPTTSFIESANPRVSASTERSVHATALNVTEIEDARRNSMTLDDLYELARVDSKEGSMSTLGSPNSSNISILKEGKYSMGHRSMLHVETRQESRRPLIGKDFHRSFDDICHIPRSPMVRPPVTFNDTATLISIRETQGLHLIPPSTGLGANNSRVRRNPDQVVLHRRGDRPRQNDTDDVQGYQRGELRQQSPIGVNPTKGHMSIEDVPDNRRLAHYSPAPTCRKLDAARPLSNDEVDKHNPRVWTFEGGPFPNTTREEEAHMRKLGASAREAHLQRSEEVKGKDVIEIKPTGLKKLLGFKATKQGVSQPTLSHNHIRLAAANAAFASVDGTSL